MSNVDTARAAYDAFGRGDLGALQEWLAEDSVWITSDQLPLGGRVEGRDNILGNFAQIPNYWTSFSVEPEEFIDAGEYVIVRGTQRAGNDKGSFEAPYVHVIKYGADGKAVLGEFVGDSAKAVALLD
ncbi:MAG TPA: nuclear transport factor 2 family protein [Solirubrobacterales bacterium]|nr:nuclear transport factor 2 family protein [Solirubrobacterales bacterium]